MTDKLELEQLEMSVKKLQLKCTFRQLHDADIHPGQFHILMMMAALGRCNQIDIARNLGVSGASVGTSVRRLEKAGLVEKSVDKSDMRATNIELTEKGKKLAAAAKTNGEKLTNVKYKGLTPQQIESYSEVLQIIKDNVQKYYDELEGRQL